MYCGASVSYMYLTKRTEDETLSVSPISLVRYHHHILRRKRFPFGNISDDFSFYGRGRSSKL